MRIRTSHKFDPLYNEEKNPAMTRYYCTWGIYTNIGSKAIWVTAISIDDENTVHQLGRCRYLICSALTRSCHIGERANQPHETAICVLVICHISLFSLIRKLRETFNWGISTRGLWVCTLFHNLGQEYFWAVDSWGPWAERNMIYHQTST